MLPRIFPVTSTSDKKHYDNRARHLAQNSRVPGDPVAHAEKLRARAPKAAAADPENKFTQVPGTPPPLPPAAIEDPKISLRRSKKTLAQRRRRRQAAAARLAQPAYLG
jgi:hypothetical protein